MRPPPQGHPDPPPQGSYLRKRLSGPQEKQRRQSRCECGCGPRSACRDAALWSPGRRPWSPGRRRTRRVGGLRRSSCRARRWRRHDDPDCGVGDLRLGRDVRPVEAEGTCPWGTRTWAVAAGPASAIGTARRGQDKTWGERDKLSTLSFFTSH